MVSDRARRWVAPLVLVGLVGLVGLGGWWTWLEVRGATAPCAAVGTETVLSLYDVVEILDDDSYRVAKGARSVVVRGTSAGLEVGASLTVGVRGESEVVEVWRELHPLRGRKRLLGYVGLAVLAVLCPVWFTIREGRVVERG